ncbi:MAG TPA: hypothetical protein VHP54_07915, partial [Caproiciproducens sp.]|nr:hypothetical protein [Caproiciproducens sp.]
MLPRASLRQKNAKITASRVLDIFVFNVQQVNGTELHYHSESLDYLQTLGFAVPPFYRRCSTISGVIDE